MGEYAPNEGAEDMSESTPNDTKTGADQMPLTELKARFKRFLEEHPTDHLTLRAFELLTTSEFNEELIVAFDIVQCAIEGIRSNPADINNAVAAAELDLRERVEAPGLQERVENLTEALFWDLLRMSGMSEDGLQRLEDQMEGVQRAPRPTYSTPIPVDALRGSLTREIKQDSPT